MKRTTFIITAIILILVTASIVLQVIRHILPQETFVLKFDLVVVEKGVGFNLDEDKLHFGSITPGGGGYRHFRINNTNSYTQRVNLETVSSQNITSWFTVEPSAQYYLASGSSKQFTSRLYVPKNTSFGNYSGFIIVKIHRAWPWNEPTEIDLPRAIPPGNENNTINESVQKSFLVP